MPASAAISSPADRVLTIYKASAGSGKTYTLTYEYILALLAIKNPDTGEYRLNHARYSQKGEIANRHRGILAITFTNKATEEMKSRITARLHDLTRVPAPGEKDADYAAELCAVTGCTRTELAQTAMAALNQLLYDFHNFNVSTIDSFFQRVLRSFARELDRQGDFEIELSVRSVMNAAVDNMLDDFNVFWREKKPLEDWLLNYMRSAVQEGDKGNILDRGSSAHRLLVDLISTICKESFTPYEAEMKAYLLGSPGKIAELSRKIDSRIADLRKESAAVARAIADELSAMPKNGGFNGRTYPFLSRKLAAGAKIDVEDLIKRVAKSESEVEYFNKTATASPDFRSRVFSAIQSSIELLLRAEELALIKKGLHTLSFLSFAWGYLDRLLSDNNLVLLANTNSLIYRIIDGSDVPFIYERLGVRLHHFLIDEFQDTSTKQWENLRPLIANSVAERHDNLIIGDVKQSIYRFRNSEPDLLHRRVQEDDFPRSSRLRGDLARDNTNHRSSVEVVKFNNTLFLRLAAMLGAPGYENVVQAVPERHAGYHGYVRFIPAPPVKEADGEKEAAELTDRERLENKYPSLPMMAAEIRRQVAEGGYRYRDIAILCSRRKECARAIEYLLAYHPDIPVLTNDSLYLVKSPAVKLVISMLRLISNVQSARAERGDTGHDYATLADMNLAVSRFEYFASDPSLASSQEDALMKALDHNETVDDAVRGILASRPASLQALVDNIIAARVPEKMRSEQLPYLMAFQDYVADYCSRGIQTVNAFLRWWDERSYKFSIPLGSDIDAVTVLTVHKAKGLEFGCLHIPFASWELLEKEYRNEPRWIAMPAIEGIDPSLMPPALLLAAGKFKDWEDSVFYHDYNKYLADGISDTTNLTYVAYTRAASELIAYYNPAKGIGEQLSQCFAIPWSESEKAAGFTLDLASCFNPETGELIIGSPTVSRKEDKQTDGTEPYRPAYDVCLRDDTRVITSVDSALELDPDIDDSPAPAPQGEEPPQVRRGNMMHEILSNIRRVSDLPRAVATVAASTGYDPAEVIEAGEFLGSALDMSRTELARWFRDFDRVLCEQSIYINTGASLPQTRRPDRIVFLPDGSVEVVDFKFTSEELPEHIGQVQEYVRLLRGMGMNVTGGWLWYPLLSGSPVVPC